MFTKAVERYRQFRGNQTYKCLSIFLASLYFFNSLLSTRWRRIQMTYTNNNYVTFSYLSKFGQGQLHGYVECKQLVDQRQT